MKVLVTFSDDVWGIIEKNCKPKLGEGDSEVVRQMVMLYLEEKGYLDPKIKLDEIKRELATQEIMIGALVQELQDKGIIKFEDWEKKVSDQVT